MNIRSIFALLVACAVTVPCFVACNKQPGNRIVVGTVTKVALLSVTSSQQYGVKQGKIEPGPAKDTVDAFFEVQDEGGNRIRFNWGNDPNETKVFSSEGKPATFGDIKEGGTIKVSAVEIEGRWIAREVRIQPPK